MSKHEIKTTLLLALLPLLVLLFIPVLVRERRTRELASMVQGNCSVALARQLIENGANVNGRTSTGQPIIEVAAVKNDRELVNLLKAFGARSTPVVASHERLWRETSFFRAVMTGDIAFIKSTLRQGFDPNFCMEGGYTPLMWAAKFGETEVVRVLLHSGANPNTHDKDGHSALLYAFGLGWNSSQGPAIVGLLLDAGIRPTANERLLMAIQKNDVAAAKAAFRAGANPNQIEFPDSSTPLMWAAGQGRPAIIRLLLQAGAKVHFSESGEMALSWASRRHFRSRNRAYDETIEILQRAMNLPGNHAAR